MDIDGKQHLPGLYIQRTCSVLRKLHYINETKAMLLQIKIQTFLPQANLLYPGDPAGAKETYKPPPPPAPAPAQPAAPAEPAPAYEEPAPAPAYNAPAPAAPSYGPPEPAASLSYDAPVPAPVYNSYEAPTTAAPAPPPVYQPSPSPAAVYVGQPSYVPSYPSIQYVPAQPTPATPTAAPTSAPAPAIYNKYVNMFLTYVHQQGFEDFMLITTLFHSSFLIYQLPVI